MIGPLLLTLFMSYATREPQDYREYREKSAVQSIAELAQKGAVDAALNRGREALVLHPKSALIPYEMGLACNRVERLTDALSFYNMALDVDPNLISALYDRAEIRLSNSNVNAAKIDLELALAKGASHWGVYLRLSEIAGLENRDEDMADYLIEAIEKGFELTLLSSIGDPWKTWMNDPQKSRILRRIVLLYAKGELWDQLKQ